MPIALVTLALLLAQAPASPQVTCPAWVATMTPAGGKIGSCMHVEGSGRTEARFDVPGERGGDGGGMAVKVTRYQPALWNMVKAGLPERMARIAERSPGTPEGEWSAGQREAPSEHSDFAGGKARYVLVTVQGVQAEPKKYYSCKCFFPQGTTVVEVTASAKERKTCEAWFDAVLKAVPR